MQTEIRDEFVNSAIGREIQPASRTATLVLPILPGKAESWRRFMQEIDASHGDAFAAWCHRSGFDVLQIWLHDTSGGATVFMMVEVISQPKLENKINKAFERWLGEQIRNLHGLDLSWLNQAEKAELIFEKSNLRGNNTRRGAPPLMKIYMYAETR